MPSPIKNSQLPDFVDELFGRLIERHSAKAEAVDIEMQSRDLLSRAGILTRNDYHSHLSLPMKVRGMPRTFVADFAIGPKERPTLVLQQVLLSRRQSIDSSAFMFEQLLPERIACAALVNSADATTSDAVAGKEMLGAMVPLVDLVNVQFALEQISTLSKASGTLPN